MLSWHWLVLGWLGLLAGGVWIAVFVRDIEAERRHPGLRARYLRKAPAIGMLAVSLVFGILGLVSTIPGIQDDLTLLWAAIATEPRITVFGPALAERIILDGTTADGSADGDEAADIMLADGRRIRTRLVVAADGRRALYREAAGI